MVRLLIEKGADVNIVNKYNYTALILSINLGNIQTKKLSKLYYKMNFEKD